MGIEWDPEKAEENRRKHGVDFTDAAAVFGDPQRISAEDPQAEGEQRFITVGMDRIGRMVTVVYTYRERRVRMISARRATRKERGDYAGR